MNLKTSRFQGVGIPIAFSFSLMALMFYFAKVKGTIGSEYELTIWSTVFALFSVIPVILQSLLSERSNLERTTILIWWPLKIGFMFYYYFYVWDAMSNPRLYLEYSDHLPFHEWATRVSDYWRSSSSVVIPKSDLIRMSVNYPAAGYIFGSMYYFFGKFPGVVLPWLAVFQFITAVTAQRVLEMANMPLRFAKVGFHIMLWSPVIWILTLLVHRDIFIIFTALTICAGALCIINGKYISGLLAVVFGTVILANLRAELLYLVLTWILLVSFIEMFKHSRSSIFQKVIIVLLCFIIVGFVSWTIFGQGIEFYNAKFDIKAKSFDMANAYMKGGATGGGVYGKTLALGGVFLLPVILPFKLLIGITAPFPWRFSSFQLLATQPFYSLESILRISLLVMIVKTIWNRAERKEAFSVQAIPVVIMGGVFAIGALLGPKSEVRYLAPAIPLLVPLFARYASTITSWGLVVPLSIFSIALLHAVYFLVGGNI